MAKSSKGDAGERIAARKQTFHNCSAAFCIMLAVLGVCLALQRDQQEGSAQTIYLLAGVFQTVMSLIALFMGVLLPEEGGRMPGWARRIVRAVAFVAMLGGRGTSGAAAYGVFNGDVVFRRFWEPAWFVAWLLFEGMLLWFYPGSGSLAALVILSMALLIALIAAAAYRYDEEVLFTINYRNDLTTACFVEYGGVNYNVTRIDTFEGYKQDITLYCKRK